MVRMCASALSLIFLVLCLPIAWFTSPSQFMRSIKKKRDVNANSASDFIKQYM